MRIRRSTPFHGMGTRWPMPPDMPSSHELDEIIREGLIPIPLGRMSDDERGKFFEGCLSIQEREEINLVNLERGFQP